MKICQKCNIEKSLNNFVKNKNRKDGLNTWCKLCVKEYKSENKLLHSIVRKKYEIINKDIISIKQNLYKNENKDHIKEKRKIYNCINSEVIASKQKHYRSNNRPKINYYHKNKRITDPLYKLRNNIRNSIYQSLKYNGYFKSKRTEEILGCTFEEFKLYIELLFKPWMTWENQGLYNGELDYGWDIDHIIPLSSAKTEEEIIKLNHFSNLQPLCSKANRDIKRDKPNY